MVHYPRVLPGPSELLSWTESQGSAFLPGSSGDGVLQANAHLCPIGFALVKSRHPWWKSESRKSWVGTLKYLCTGITQGTVFDKKSGVNQNGERSQGWKTHGALFECLWKICTVPWLVISYLVNFWGGSVPDPPEAKPSRRALQNTTRGPHLSNASNVVSGTEPLLTVPSPNRRQNEMKPVWACGSLSSPLACLQADYNLPLKYQTCDQR